MANICGVNNYYPKSVRLNEVRLGSIIKVEDRWSKVTGIRWDRNWFYFKTDHPDYRCGGHEVRKARGRNITVLITYKLKED